MLSRTHVHVRICVVVLYVMSSVCTQKDVSAHDLIDQCMHTPPGVRDPTGHGGTCTQNLDST